MPIMPEPQLSYNRWLGYIIVMLIYHYQAYVVKAASMAAIITSQVIASHPRGQSLSPTPLQYGF